MANKPGNSTTTAAPSGMNPNNPTSPAGNQMGNGMNAPQRPPNNQNGWNNNNQSAYNNNSMSSANTVSTVPQNGNNMNGGKGNQLVPPGQQPGQVPPNGQSQQWGQNPGQPNSQPGPGQQWGQQPGPGASQAPPGQQWGQTPPQGAGQPPQQQQWGQGPGGMNNQQTNMQQGPLVQGNGKQLKKGEKKSDPSMAFTTEFLKACQNAPKANTRDRSIIYWDHGHENFVYGEQEYDFKGKLTKKDINAAVSSLSGDPSWNPTKQCETCVIGYMAWIAVVILVVIIIVSAYSTETGTKDFTWVIYAAGGIAIIFGGVLALCCREMANRLSWRKRLLMFGALDRLEQTNLAGTDMGIRSGKEGAWIEYGFKNSLDKFRPSYVPVAQNQPAVVTVTPPPQNPPQQYPPVQQYPPQNSQVQQSQFVPAKTETNQTQFAPVRTEQTNPNQQSRWVEMTNQQQQNPTSSGFGPAQPVSFLFTLGVQPKTSETYAFYTKTEEILGPARNAKEWGPCPICGDHIQDVRLCQARAGDHF